MLKVKKDKNKEKKQNFNNYGSFRRFDNYQSGYEFDTIDLNDTYDFDTKFDVDFAYDEYDAFDNRSRYVEPCTEPRYSSFREYEKEDGKLRSEKKKRKLSPSMKALIVVYFAIVAIIASLLIVNALPMMNATNADLSVNGLEEVDAVGVEADTVNNVVLADGTVVATEAANGKYEYTVYSNWFDNVCDWMENLVA